MREEHFDLGLAIDGDADRIALIVEMLAAIGKHISELQETVFGITGRLYTVEDNLPATADMRIVVPQRVKAMIASGATPYPVVKVTDYDGTKVYFEHDNWALLRFSGTEPVLRIFAEADTPEKARELAEAIRPGVTPPLDTPEA